VKLANGDAKIVIKIENNVKNVLEEVTVQYIHNLSSFIYLIKAAIHTVQNALNTVLKT
jgi:hypothetical protein